MILSGPNSPTNTLKTRFAAGINEGRLTIANRLPEKASHHTSPRRKLRQAAGNKRRTLICQPVTTFIRPVHWMEGTAFGTQRFRAPRKRTQPEKSLSTLTARDLMTASVVTVRPEDSVESAARLMRELSALRSRLSTARDD